MLEGRDNSATPARSRRRRPAFLVSATDGDETVAPGAASGPLPTAFYLTTATGRQNAPVCPLKLIGRLQNSIGCGNLSTSAGKLSSSTIHTPFESRISCTTASPIE